jgi:hypothetical protein
MSQLELFQLPSADAKVAHGTPIGSPGARGSRRVWPAARVSCGRAGRGQRIVLVAPPSMKRSAPWIWAARGEARNATRLATSSGSP